MSPLVMVSYSHKQIDFVESLVRRLKAANVKLWIDREGVRSGKPWRRELIDAVLRCDVLLPVLSPAFLDSAPCRLEVLTARSFSKKIVPVMIEECTKDLLLYPETKGIEDIFMMYFTDLRSVGLKLSENEAYQRVINGINYDTSSRPERPVYVAYIWSEAEFADRIAKNLAERGQHTWIATRDVPLGVRWFDEQVRALHRAKAMVVVINEEAVKGSLLRTEIILASARGIQILPVLSDSVKGEASKIQHLRQSVRAYDDTLVLYDLHWFSSDPNWHSMIDLLIENISDPR